MPLNVPDEEILNPCMSYGDPVGWVSREKLTNNKDKGIPGSNRSVEVNMNDGAAFENFTATASAMMSKSMGYLCLRDVQQRVMERLASC